MPAIETWTAFDDAMLADIGIMPVRRFEVTGRLIGLGAVVAIIASAVLSSGQSATASVDPPAWVRCPHRQDAFAVHAVAGSAVAGSTVAGSTVAGSAVSGSAGSALGSPVIFACPPLPR